MVAAVGVPKYKGDAPDYKVLCRLGYVLSHNSEHKTPDWAIERLTPDRFSGPGDRDAQGNPFAADPDLKGGPRAELNDYKGSGFDRGHMAPAASMKFSEDATKESFYLSNMSPQVGKGLNRSIWADLEALTRDWACERGEVIAITGPIYDTEKPKGIGDNKVAIPNAFYKIAYDPKNHKAIAFILPNKAIDKKGKKSWDVLKDYIVPVSEVESRVDIDFLSALPKRERNRIEPLKSVMWPSRKACAKE
jgi:endonuclease G